MQRVFLFLEILEMRLERHLWLDLLFFIDDILALDFGKLVIRAFFGWL